MSNLDKDMRLIITIVIGAMILYAITNLSPRVASGESYKPAECQNCLIKTRQTSHRLVLEFDSDYDLARYVEFMKHQQLFPYTPDRTNFKLEQDYQGNWVLR